MSKKRIFVIETKTMDLKRSLEFMNCQIMEDGVYVVAVEQTIKELKKNLETRSGQAQFSIFEVTNFDFSGDYYHLDNWMKEQRATKPENKVAKPRKRKEIAPTEKDLYATQKIKLNNK